MFGIGALRFARDRPNSDVLLGNHEVAMLWALRDRTRIGYWMSIGGQRHDLDELSKDQPLQQWMRERPALLRHPDRTIFQHCGSDTYLDLVGQEHEHIVAAVNARTKDLLDNGGEATLWELLSGPNIFQTQPLRLDRWLELTGSRRAVFGHKPHRNPRPQRYHDGKAINFDGGLSRSHRMHQRGSPVTASIGPLED